MRSTIVALLALVASTCLLFSSGVSGDVGDNFRSNWRFTNTTFLPLDFAAKIGSLGRIRVALDVPDNAAYVELHYINGLSAAVQLRCPGASQHQPIAPWATPANYTVQVNQTQWVNYPIAGGVRNFYQGGCDVFYLDGTPAYQQLQYAYTNIGINRPEIVYLIPGKYVSGYELADSGTILLAGDSFNGYLSPHLQLNGEILQYENSIFLEVEIPLDLQFLRVLVQTVTITSSRDGFDFIIPVDGGSAGQQFASVPLRLPVTMFNATIGAGYPFPTDAPFFQPVYNSYWNGTQWIYTPVTNLYVGDGIALNGTFGYDGVPYIPNNHTNWKCTVTTNTSLTFDINTLNSPFREGNSEMLYMACQLGAVLPSLPAGTYLYLHLYYAYNDQPSNWQEANWFQSESEGTVDYPPPVFVYMPTARPAQPDSSTGSSPASSTGSSPVTSSTGAASSSTGATPVSSSSGGAEPTYSSSSSSGGNCPPPSDEPSNGFSTGALIGGTAGGAAGGAFLGALIMYYCTRPRFRPLDADLPLLN